MEGKGEGKKGRGEGDGGEERWVGLAPLCEILNTLLLLAM